MADLQALNDQFRIPGVAEVITDRGGLPAVWIDGSTASQGANGTVYLHGGHVSSWKPPHSDEVLWLSEKSMWQADKPIRGGVPLCFPWFGPSQIHPQLPPHGFARLRPWKLESLQATAGGIRVSLVMQADESTRALWPADFELRHIVTFGRQLVMTLELANRGTSACTAEEAQHTYFSVDDVRNVRVKGLANARYIDKVDGMKEKSQEGDIAITGETDRVYLATTSPVTIEDPGKRRRIVVAKDHSDASVVWNPWIAKAKAMADFGDEEWPAMLCVETCNVGPHAITVPAGGTHRMTTTVSVESL